MSKYLYGAAVQGIQDFIFKTNELKHSVGAREVVHAVHHRPLDCVDVLALERRQILHPVEQLLEVLLVGAKPLDGQRPVLVERVELLLRRYLDSVHLRAFPFLVFVSCSRGGLSPVGTPI